MKTFRKAIKAPLQDVFHPDFEQVMTVLAKRAAAQAGYFGPLQIAVDESTGVILITDCGPLADDASDADAAGTDN